MFFHTASHKTSSPRPMALGEYYSVGLSTIWLAVCKAVWQNISSQYSYGNIFLLYLSYEHIAYEHIYIQTSHAIKQQPTCVLKHTIKVISINLLIIGFALLSADFLHNIILAW